MNSKIILISGKQGSGKTTLAKKLQIELQRHKGVAVYQFIFAGPLYEMHDFCLGTLKEAGFHKDVSKDGKLLQLLGTEWARETISQTIWVDICKARIARQLRDTWADMNFFIISDCRFKNELDLFPDALSIRLEAPKDVRKIRCSQWRDKDDHASEIDLDDYAILKKFDLVYDTGPMGVGPDRIASHILEHLTLDGKLI